MLSREADSCFWIGRYVERAEATARMLDVHYHATLEGVPGMLAWESVLAIADCAEDFHKHHDQLNERTAIQYFVFDTDNPGSIVSALTCARENARSIREMVDEAATHDLRASRSGDRPNAHFQFGGPFDLLFRGT